MLKNLCTLEFRIDRTPRLLIIPFFATLPNLIQHSLLINFGEFCQPPFLFHTPRLLSHVQSTAVAWSLGKATKLMYMFFYKHDVYDEAWRSVKRIDQKNRWFFMQINYLCISFVLFANISIRSFDDFISMKFLIAVSLPASSFIPTSPFINFGDFCQPPRLLFWPKFASLSVYFALPFYLKLERK